MRKRRRLVKDPPPSPPPSLSYRLLSAASYAPQQPERMLRLAGLWFDCTSPTVEKWQRDLFTSLLSCDDIRQTPEGLYALTCHGEDTLNKLYRIHGAVKLERL